MRFEQILPLMREGKAFRRPSWPVSFLYLTQLNRCHFDELFIVKDTGTPLHMEYPYVPVSRADLVNNDWEQVFDLITA